jgi:hypothetical protein
LTSFTCIICIVDIIIIVVIIIIIIIICRPIADTKSQTIDDGDESKERSDSTGQSARTFSTYAGRSEIPKKCHRKDQKQYKQINTPYSVHQAYVDVPVDENPHP